MAEESRPTLVFIHGAAGSALQWNYQTVHFRRLGYRILAVDLPGHGRRGGRGYNDIERYADFVAALLREEGLEGPVLCGHSMGGAVCLTLAKRHPDAYHGLALVGAGARLRVRPGFLARLSLDPDTAMEELVRQSYARTLSARDLRRAMQQLREMKPETLYGDFLACDKFDITEEVGEITTPALIVVGRDDLMTPPKYSEYLRADLPNSRLVIVAEAGHMVMIEQWREFNGLLRGFLADLSADGEVRP